MSLRQNAQDAENTEAVRCALTLIQEAKDEYSEIPYPSAGIYQTIHILGNDILIWRERGFDPPEVMRNLQPPLVEIAGPSPFGYWLLPLQRLLPAPMVISNILPKEACVSGDPPYPGAYRFQADARFLSLRSASIGAVFCCSLSDTESVDRVEEKREKALRSRVLRVQAMREAMRILRPGGFLVWHAARREDLRVGQKIGFDLKYFVSTWSKRRKRMKEIPGSIFWKPTE